MGDIGRALRYQCKMSRAGSVARLGSRSCTPSLSSFVVGAAESSWTIFVVSGEVVVDVCVRSSVVFWGEGVPSGEHRFDIEVVVEGKNGL